MLDAETARESALSVRARHAHPFMESARLQNTTAAPQGAYGRTGPRARAVMLSSIFLPGGGGVGHPRLDGCGVVEGARVLPTP